MNGFSHRYHLGESTFIFRSIRSDFEFLFHFSLHSAASHLGLFCLPMFKGTPGLNELTAKPPRGRLPVEVVFYHLHSKNKGTDQPVLSIY